MGRKSAARMRVHNPTLAKAVLFDKPALNVVYAPQLFQPGRDTFGGDFLFNPAHARRAGANRLPLSRVVERSEALV